MKIIDYYVLRQFVTTTLSILLLFFCIVLLAQSIRIVDTVAQFGAGAALFFELTVYLAPRVLIFALPISVFVTVLLVIHRLHSDSELFAIYTAGSGAQRLLRPVLVYAVGIALITALVTMLLAPWAAGESRNRQAQLRSAIEPRLMRDGQFLSPRAGLTAFVSEIGRDRSLKNLFLYDQDSEDGSVTVYTAQRGWLQADSNIARLILQDGVALRFDQNWKLVSRLTYDQFMQNLLEPERTAGSRKRRPSEMYMRELLSYEPDGRKEGEHAQVRAEIHERFSSPLYALALPFLALASMLAGFNQAQISLARISIGAALGIALILSAFATRNIITATPELTWSMYVPPALSVVVSVLLLLNLRGVPGLRMAFR